MYKYYNWEAFQFTKKSIKEFISKLRKVELLKTLKTVKNKKTLA